MTLNEPEGFSNCTLAELQAHFADVYGLRDRDRGAAGTFLWLCAEVGELAESVQHEDRDSAKAEIADVLAWTLSLANVLEIDLSDAIFKKYGKRCPGCGYSPCRCERAVKP